MTEAQKILQAINGSKIKEGRITSGLNKKSRIRIDGMKMAFKAGVKEILEDELKDVEAQRTVRKLDNLLDRV